MTREAEMKALLIADAPLMAILTGGIFTEQELGVEGIRRGGDNTTENPSKNAFDAEGRIKPTLLIREGNVVPYGDLRSGDGEFIAVSQTLMLYFMEFRGHDQIDLARDRVKVVLKEKRLGRSYPVAWLFDSLPVPDSGPVLNSTTATQVWQCVSTRVLA
jgi:hypothetical protein